jgi:hypothetical protein
MTAAQIISLFGLINYEKINSFLMNHCLKDYSQEEITKMVAQLNCDHSSGSADCCVEVAPSLTAFSPVKTELH